jgi:hypothetical protein
LENVIPIQCSQTVPKTVSQEVTATPPSTIKTDSKRKTVSQTKKSKSFDSSKICRSNRIAFGAGVKPVIDATVYSISDSDGTVSDTPKTMSSPQIKTYSRKNSLSKAKTKPSENSESSGEEDVPIQQPSSLIHKSCLINFENFSRNKPVLPGRVYNFDDLINTDHDLTKFTNPLGWTHLFNIRETHYPYLIKAFYFNVVISSEKSYIVSELKGKKIKVTEQLLGSLLNLPLSGHKLFGPSWFKMAGLDKKDLMSEMFELGTTLKKFPPSSQLKHEFKMLHNMCLHSIFPRKGSKDKVTKNDMMMMYHLF